MRSDDSGLGVSDNGQVCTKRQHHSGGETHRRPPVMAQDKVCTHTHVYIVHMVYMYIILQLRRTKYMYYTCNFLTFKE